MSIYRIFGMKKNPMPIIGFGDTAQEAVDSVLELHPSPMRFAIVSQLGTDIHVSADGDSAYKVCTDYMAKVSSGGTCEIHNAEKALIRVGNNATPKAWQKMLSLIRRNCPHCNKYAGKVQIKSTRKTHTRYMPMNIGFAMSEYTVTGGRKFKT